jgi:hypothetical protein
MKKISDEKVKGNIGQSMFEALVSQYAVPNKIDESKDIGIDYICEWKNGNEPTGIMFTAQVKNYPSKEANFVDKDQKLNLLETYKITPAITIDRETQGYWNLLGLPCYLFVVIPNGNSVDLFYKRYTPIVNGKADQSKSPFYKVNDQLKFLAFANTESKFGGFARDLYIDQMRSNYNKGLIAYLNPRRLGLEQFPDTDTDVYFKDIFEEYKTNFEVTFRQLKSVFGNDDEHQAVPSQAPDEE